MIFDRNCSFMKTIYSSKIQNYPTSDTNRCLFTIYQAYSDFQSDIKPTYIRHISDILPTSRE